MQQHHVQAFLVGSPEDFALHDYVLTESEVRDFFWPQLGIAEARELTTAAFLRPESATHKTIVVRSNFITHEAQNAMLKLLEEPPQDTAFLLVQPTDFHYLATITSRLGSITKEVTEPHGDWNNFLASGYADRLIQIEARLKAKDMVWILALKHGLIHWLSNDERLSSATVLTRLNLVVTYLLTRGASNKMLLEELALTLPVPKQ